MKRIPIIMSSTLSILLVLFSCAPVSALTPQERWHYANVGIEFIDEPCAPGSGTTTTKSTGHNARDAFVRLVETYGLTPEQAAGIVGNLRAESGVIPTRLEGHPPDYIATAPINGKGFGIAQWTYTSRQAPLVAFAEKQGKPVTDLFVQVDYLWHELTHGYKSVLADIKKATTVREATDIFLQRFEIPRDHSSSVTDFRTRLAQEVLTENRQYLTGASATATPDSGGDSCATAGGTVTGVNCESIGKKSEGGKDNPYLCDSKEVKCNAGKDMGTDMGYNRAMHFSIFKCKVHGIIVNAFISGNVDALVNQADKEGYKLGGGGFRTMQGQLDTRRANGCFPRDNIGQPNAQGFYPESVLEANRRRTPPEVGGCGTLTATPGYSNHQMGLAIDFTCDGDLIRSKGNRCYQWLTKNAAKYGLYDKIADVEPWHWSVTGG